MITPFTIIKISSFPIFGIILYLIFPATVVHFFKRGVFNFNKFFFSVCQIVFRFKLLPQTKYIFLFNFFRPFLKNTFIKFNLWRHKFQSVFSRAFSNKKILPKKIIPDALTVAVFLVECPNHMRGKFYPRNLIIGEIQSSDLNFLYDPETYILLRDFYKRSTSYICLKEALLGESLDLKVRGVDSTGQEYLVKISDLINDLSRSEAYELCCDHGYYDRKLFLVSKEHMMPPAHVFPIGTPSMVLEKYGVLATNQQKIRVQTAHAIPETASFSDYLCLRDCVSREFYLVEKGKAILVEGKYHNFIIEMGPVTYYRPKIKI
uniref:Uncharacterized protein n=1 Tax=Surirella sp. TaxID=1526603 RepID=A0A2R4A3J6_9STRA|nr:hypothetical protein [Surirella sp.]